MSARFLSGPRRLAWPRTSPFHGGNTGSNPVGDANKTKCIENRPKVINRKAFTCFKDLAFYSPRQSLGNSAF